MRSKTPDDADAYPLRVGDRVFDRFHISAPTEDPELAIVIDVLDTDVYETTFGEGDRETSLADYQKNRDHADFDVSTRAVSIVFASFLSNHFPEWSDYASDPDGLSKYLDERDPEWSVPLSEGTFDYPEARLQLAYRP